jgi:hypothetical protein
MRSEAEPCKAAFRGAHYNNFLETTLCPLAMPNAIARSNREIDKSKTEKPKIDKIEIDKIGI